MRTLASGQNSAPAAGANGKNEYVTLESGDHFSFHYVLSSGVVILTLTERAYPKRLAFDYLDELCREFFNVYGSQVARASRPYEFIRFDTFIQKTKKVYGDSRTQRNLDRISTELRDVHSIMTKNINDVISRGEKLESTYESDIFAVRYCLVLTFSLFIFCVYRYGSEIESSRSRIKAVRGTSETCEPYARCTPICACCGCHLRCMCRMVYC